MTVRVVVLLACAVAGLAGCDAGGGAATAAAGGKAARKAPLHLVETHLVEREPLRISRELTGTSRTRRIHRVFTQEEGRVVALPWREGDAVAPGDRLLRLDTALLDAQLARAEAVSQDARAQVAQYERLGKSRAVAAEEVRQARTALSVAEAEQRLLRTRLGFAEELAPFAGLVSERLAEVGDFLSKGTHVLTVADPASLVVDVDVGERLLARVPLGQPVELRFDALEGRALGAEVVRVHPALDPRSRQGRVEVVAREWPAAARAGQLARVKFEIDAGMKVQVPPFAVRRDVRGEFVYRVLEVPGEKATVERTEVRVGRRLVDRVEVLEGLDGGERIVVRGFLGLRDGKTVQAREAVPLTEPS